MDNLLAEGIQLRANQVTDESAESTRRILVYTLRLIFHVSFIVSFFILSVYFSRFFCFQDLEALPNAAI
ncbi:hypothetical protein K5549_013365 [Capra hircus]|nr:hypothetical protein K5549_013365 [Capra hircus]